MNEKQGTEHNWFAPIEIDQLIFGVRYERRHSVLDHIGAVSDEILRAKETPFGPDVFPLLQALPHEHRLLDPDSEALLRITASDTILILPTHLDNVEGLAKAASDFDTFVLEPLRRISKVSGIVRHGVVLNLSGESANLANPPIKRFLASELALMTRANSVSIRFTKRLATDEALTRKDVDDYRNVIYNIGESEEGDVNISVDYQQYFKPSLSGSEWSERSFPRFVWGANGYFKGEFSKWLERSVGIAEVA